MSFNISYSLEYSRIIPACMIDARKSTALANQIGVVIKTLVDAQKALIQDDVLFYRVDTNNGNLVGYFAVKVNMSNHTGSLLIQTIRPAFTPQLVEINQQISNFIINGNWKSDFLFMS